MDDISLENASYLQSLEENSQKESIETMSQERKTQLNSVGFSWEDKNKQAEASPDCLGGSKKETG